MNPINPSDFSKTPLAKQLLELVTREGRYIEFCAFSREGYPAVTALRAELAEIIDPIFRKDLWLADAAKEYCKNLVNKIMEERGHVILKRQMNVPGQFFDVAPLWSSAPQAHAGATEREDR